MKLFGIRDGSYNYRIEEFDVEKETEKQYVVINSTDKFFSAKYTINKKDMKNLNHIFTLTHEEAIAKQRELIRTEIESKQRLINRSEDRISDLYLLLDTLEEWEKKGNG